MGPAHDTDAVLVDEGQRAEVVVEGSVGIRDTFGYRDFARVAADLIDAAAEEAMDFQRDVAPAVEVGGPEAVARLRSATAMKQNEGGGRAVAGWPGHDPANPRIAGLQGDGVAADQQ